MNEAYKTIIAQNLLIKACRYLLLLASICMYSYANAAPEALKISSSPDHTSESIFYKRIWFYKAASTKTWNPPEGQFSGTQVVDSPSAQSPWDFRGGCPDDNAMWCTDNILTTHGYYYDDVSSSKERHGALLIRPIQEPPFLLALLDIDFPGEGLAPAILARFSPQATMPSCHIPVALPAPRGYFIYGGWQLRSVYSTSSGNYVVWLGAGGGDDTDAWTLESFLSLTPNCILLDRSDYYFSIDTSARSLRGRNCQEAFPDTAKWFKISSDGTIIVSPQKYKCYAVTMKPIKNK